MEAIPTHKTQLSKHARKAIRNGRRRDSKCDRRSLHRNLRDLAKNYDGITVISIEGGIS